MTVTTPIIATQVPLPSFDEFGVARILDHLQETCGVNTLRIHADDRIAAFSHLHRTESEAPAWNLTGLPMVEANWRATSLRCQPYCGAIPADRRMALLQDLRRELDARGMRLQVRMIIGPDRARGAYGSCLMQDADGRTLGVPCWNDPDFRGFLRGVAEDCFRTAPIRVDGYLHMAEFGGALSGLLFAGHGSGACFCRYCCARARDEGIDVIQARNGFQSLKRELGPGWGRVSTQLGQYPAVLAWDRMTTDAFHECIGMVAGIVRDSQAHADVGVHILHTASWNTVQRETVYAAPRLLAHADQILPLLYTRLSGQRLRGSVLGYQRAFLPHLDESHAYRQWLELNGLDPGRNPTWAAISAGAELDAEDYVGSRTRAWKAELGGNARLVANVGWEDEWAESEVDPRETQTYRSVRAAIAGGADGIFISRGYAADLCFGRRPPRPTNEELSAGHTRTRAHGDVGPRSIAAFSAALSDCGWRSS